MAPFDGAGARRGQDRGRQDQRQGRRRRDEARDQDLQHPGRRPDGVEGLRRQAHQPDHANVIFTTCDVDLAAPVVQEALNKGLLTIAPCIGTDQMGPKRFGAKGKLAFSFGNVAQDEGSAMARARVEQGLEDRRPREGHDDRLLQGRRHRLQGSVHAARREDQVRDDVPGSGARAGLDELRRRRERRSPRIRRTCRHLDRGRVRRARSVHHRPADGGRQRRRPQLLGR